MARTSSLTLPRDKWARAAHNGPLMPEPSFSLPDETLRRLSAGQRVFGRFALERVLGQGGMGVVWKARDEALEKDVALKFVLESRARDPEAVASLKHETRRCQELRHVGIVTIYDLHQDGEHVAVSMEYVVGATLASRKADRGLDCFEPEEILPWLEQLGAALTYAHNEARVVHRDLKPSNLILTDTGRLKVMDFGISQHIADTIAGKTNTGVDGISLPYGSPQQLLGERARVADDVYSLAATIYDLLTGRPPFFRGKLDLQVLEVAPPPMSERRQELGRSGGPIPRQWEEVIAASLAKEPEARPSSVSELVTALREGWRHREIAAPVVKIAVPPPSTAPTPTPISRVPASETTEVKSATPVGWVPTHDARRLREASWPVVALFVLAMAALAAYGLHLVRHSLAPEPALAAPASTPVPETPRPDSLRPAALQPTSAGKAPR